MAFDLMNAERGQIPLTVILDLFKDLKSQIIYNCKNSKHYTKALKRIRSRKLKKKSYENAQRAHSPRLGAGLASELQ